MKILLFGCTGLIGTAITKVCKDRNRECESLSHSDVDICDYDDVDDIIKSIKPDVVINATGLVGINKCEDNPVLAFKVNTLAAGHLAKSCQENDVTIVQPSTHNVFNGKKQGYYTERDIPNPIQVYGASKYASEYPVSRCDKYYIVRFPTLFGDRSNGKSAFPTNIISWIKNGTEFKISCNKVDSPSYSIDAANAVLDLLNDQYPYGIYHIANCGCTTYDMFVLEISNILGIKAKATLVSEKEFETKAPNALLTAMTSVKIPQLRTWQEALKEYLNEG